MIEFIVFVLSLGADQLMKFWSMRALVDMPGGVKDIIPGVLWFSYAENYGDSVAYLRGRSMVMNIVRLLQFLLVIYLLFFKRDKLKLITRIGLVFFLAGMVGNQINYLLMNFVPDMIVFSPIKNYTFNLADVWVVIAMVILFIRILFFEGQDLTNWLSGKFSKKKDVSRFNDLN